MDGVYEGTGLYGRSSLRADLSGEMQRVDLPA